MPGPVVFAADVLVLFFSRGVWMAFTLEFDAPQHGWLPFRLETGGVVFQDAASDVLNDPLRAFVSAVKSVLRTEPHGLVHLWLEPSTSILELLRHSGDDLTLRLLDHDDTVLEGVAGTIRAEDSLSPHATCETILDSLDRLSTKWPSEAEPPQWEHRFPHGELREARELLRETSKADRSGPPTAGDIAPHGDLDAGVAAASLANRSAAEAAELLADDSLGSAEDYLWMGPKAFVYYCSALLRYLRSPEADGDDLFAYGMISTFRSRVRTDRNEVDAAIPAMRAFCQRAVQDFDRLGFSEKYRARLPRRIAELEREIEGTPRSGD